MRRYETTKELLGILDNLDSVLEDADGVRMSSVGADVEQGE